MPTVDGLAAAALMQTWKTCDPGYCLRYVWAAYAAQGATSAASYPTALAAWNASKGKVPGDRNPPAGFPVYWGEKPGSAAGDVVISLGGGRVVATDYPGWGVIGTCTIDQRQAQIGRPYLGWTTDILGNPIEGEDMALSQDDINKIAKAVWGFMIQAQNPDGTNIPNASFPARGMLASANAAAQAASAKAVWDYQLRAQDGDGNYMDVTYPARGFLAATNAAAQAGTAEAVWNYPQRSVNKKRR